MPTIPHSSRNDYKETTGVIANLTLGAALRGIGIGLTPWGPIAGETIGGVKQSYVEIPSWPEFKRVFGNFEATHPFPKATWAFFKTGGQILYVARTQHFTDPTNPATATAVRATYTIKSTQAIATYGTVTASNTALYELTAGDDLDCKVDGGATDTATFDATEASVTDTTTYPVTAGTGFLILKVDRGTAQTITFLGTETTADQIAATINAQLLGGWAEVSGGQVVIHSDTEGLGSYIEVTTNPVANPLLTFPTSEVQGTSTAGVQDIKNVTIAQVKACVEAQVTGVTVTDNGDDTFSIVTDTSGAAGSIQVEASSTADTAFGLDNTVHSGTDTSETNALQVDGKYAGARGNTFQVTVAAATSGDANFFDLIVIENSVVEERIFNVDYSTVDAEVARRSDRITTTSLADYNPDAGTYTLISGDDGLALLDDNDYAGDMAAGTGIRAFDGLKTFRLALTDRETAPHVKAFQTYLKTTRKAIGILLYDCPTGNTYAQARTYMTGNSLTGYGEFGAAYWPYAKWPSPDRNIFGANVDEVEFPSAAAVAGRCVWVSAQRDAGFADEAANKGRGTFTEATDIADLDANKEWVRDLLYPDLINPIRAEDGVVFNDGVLTNYVDGNFPTVAQRIVACETAQRVLALLDGMRHRGLSEDGLKERYSKIDAILLTLTKAGAFISKKVSEAYYIDDSGNTPEMRRQLRYKVKIGIATIDPGEFNELELGYNERGLYVS